MSERAVLLLGPSTGGIRRHVGALAAHLVARGWAVTTAGPAGVLEPDSRWRHETIAVPEGPADLVRLGRLRRQVASLCEGATVLHAHGLKAAWLASLAPRRAPLVATVHNLVLREAAGRATAVLRRLEARIPSRVDHVIAVSEEIGRRFAGAANLTVIPPAGPPPVPVRTRTEVRVDAGVPEGAPMVVCVARLHPQKDLPTALRALAGMAERAHLVVVGTGPDAAALHELAGSLGVADRVHWVGQRDNPADELAAADAVLISSLWESGPLVLLEAMQLAAPVVTTPVGLGSDLVTDGITGRLVPVGDHESMARALDEVVGDPARASRLGVAGRERVLATFGPDELASRVVAVYGEASR